jgi:hypothetical protein
MLEFLYLAALSSLISCLWARPEAYFRVENLKGAHSDMLWPYSQTLDKARKASQERARIGLVCKLLRK